MYSRYALYFTLPDGPLARFGAGWLGWDVATGKAAEHPEIPGLAIPDLTARPSKYGFHATLKPPFVLAEGLSAADLEAKLAAYVAHTPAVEAQALRLTRLGGFLALTPAGKASELTTLAAKLVRAFDNFRAPPGSEELARRRATGLSEEQEANLQRWGYPYVMEEFRFHITLTRKLTDAEAEATEKALAPHITPLLPKPFRLEAITLAGERADGFFEEITRIPLAPAKPQ